MAKTPQTDQMTTVMLVARECGMTIYDDLNHAEMISVCLFNHLSIYIFIYLSIYLYIYIY